MKFAQSYADHYLKQEVEKMLPDGLKLALKARKHQNDCYYGHSGGNDLRSFYYGGNFVINHIKDKLKQ